MAPGDRAVSIWKPSGFSNRRRASTTCGWSSATRMDPGDIRPRCPRRVPCFGRMKRGESTRTGVLALNAVRMRDDPVHRRTDAASCSCDDRAVNRALQIALPFDPSAEPASAPTRITVVPAGTTFAPTGIPIAPSSVPLAPASIALAPASVTLAPLYFVRHRRARRYLLRVESDGQLRVTIPRGGSKREAEAFAARNLQWVCAQRARVTAPPVDSAER